jgi:SAM-dependent methyltransferase
MVSLWYSHPFLYDVGMTIIHGTNYSSRYSRLAKLVLPGSSVLDIGCGSCRLYHFMKKNTVSYTGWDTNRHFVRNAQKKGINALMQDCTTVDVPETDYIVLSDVLHHIGDNDSKLVRDCLSKARKALVVIEPFADPPDMTRKVYFFLREIRRTIPCIETILGENDGTNAPRDIHIKQHRELDAFLDSFGKNEKTVLGNEIIAVYLKQPTDNHIHQ